MDTTNILFICGGAFVGIETIIHSRLPDRNNADLLTHVMPTDLVRYGIIPELVGRLSVVAALSPLTQGDLEAILTAPRDAILKQFRKQCQCQGFDVQYTSCAVDAMATLALRMQTGARALRSVVEEVMLDVQFNAKKGCRYIVDRDVVLGRKPPKEQKL